MRLAGILQFKGTNGYRETDPLVLLSTDRPAARAFVLSFVESRSVRLTLHTEEGKKATEEERQWYEQFTAGLEEGKDFFPFAMSRERFMDGPGHRGRASARIPSQDAYRKYQAVLAEHRSFLDPAAAQAAADVMWSQEVVVVRRPKVHPLNHVLLGQGSGIPFMSADEGQYLKPFMQASRLWLGKSLVAFPSLQTLTTAMLKAVVIPTSEWLEAERHLTEDVTLTEVRCGRRPTHNCCSCTETPPPPTSHQCAWIIFDVGGSAITNPPS